MFKKLGSKLKEQKGFTLIELLAVIVILGIIAAIAIPAISNVISKSETKAEAQEGVQIINAAKLIVANNEVVFDNTGTAVIPREGANASDVDLMTYLDRVDAPAASAFTVTVKKVDASTGKFSYTLKLHPVNTSLNDTDLTEQELIEAAK
jgi:type IV pilus assembly protein PilA